MSLRNSMKRLAKSAIALLLAMFALTTVLLVGDAVPVEARTAKAAIPVIVHSRLPVEAQRTIGLIQKGGPFPYPQKDGTVFGNFERRLPSAARGYYREYTVPTPGVRHRGARRIVTGGRQDYYYTADHYQSFSLVQFDR